MILHASIRRSMEQLNDRYMTDADKKKRVEILEAIGELLRERKQGFFKIVQQFVSMISAEDDKIETMDIKKKGQFEIEWLRLKKLKISVDAETRTFHYLISLISELSNIETFDEAFFSWKGKQKVLWRHLRGELSSDGKMIHNLDFEKQSRIFRNAIVILSASLTAAFDDVLKEMPLPNENEKLYATLLLEKSNIEEIRVSELSEYYTTVAWVFIHKKTETRIKNILERFNSNEKV